MDSQYQNKNSAVNSAVDAPIQQPQPGLNSAPLLLSSNQQMPSNIEQTGYFPNINVIPDQTNAQQATLLGSPQTSGTYSGQVNSYASSQSLNSPHKQKLKITLASNSNQRNQWENIAKQPQVYIPMKQPVPLQIPQHYGMGHNKNIGSEPNKTYNDDEPLIEKVKQEKNDVKIQLQIKAQRSLVKLKTQTSLPALATLRSSGGSRTSVDLVCVIDNSGSMEGQKIQLVKSTVKFLLETLTPSDRLSIITFNSISTRLCGLKCVSGENMQGFLNIVNQIRAGGGTNINSGLSQALKTMRERKYINKVTSVFLLSDGQDKGAEDSFKNSLEEPRNKQLAPFTLHSFGFGSDHDEQLMSKLCQMRDGAFYFIKQLATLDEAFCNALGGIISLVATEVVIKINNTSKNIVDGIKIKKVYGKMWQKINQKEYKIKITQLMSGVTKDFVFQLQIPSINVEVGDLQRDHNVIEGLFQAKSITNQKISGQCVLQLTLLNENQEIPDTIQNVDVIENYLRVQAAEAIQQNLKKADKQQYAEAQKGIETMIKTIQQNKKARKQKMMTLLTDLNQIKQKCSHKNYSEGRKLMMSSQITHTMQNNFQYSNTVQSDMLTYMKSSKY